MVSCDYGYLYRYEIINNTECRITVDIKTDEGNVNYVIEKHETKMIYETTHGVQGSKGPYFRDVYRDLKKCVVSRNDTISNKNYLDNSSWNFIIDKIHMGHYTTTVIDDEFK